MTYDEGTERAAIERYTFVPTDAALGAASPFMLVTLGMGATLGTFPSFDAALDAACDRVLAASSK